MARVPQFHFRIGLLLAVVTLLLSGPEIASAASTADAGQRSQQILERLAAPRGLCAVVGESGDLAIELAQNSQWLIYVRAADERRAAEIRAEAERAGFGIDRVVVEAGPLDSLPFAANLVDAVIIPEASGELLDALSAVEVVRVLRPQGVAIVGRASDTTGPDVAGEQLHKWAKSAATENLKVTSDNLGTWLQFDKPVLAGADDWSHWEKDATNNPVSEDLLIKAPYMTQFMTGPFYIGMPAVTTISGGRTFWRWGILPITAGRGIG
jgi:SAM-dependent methyltransferase